MEHLLWNHYILLSSDIDKLQKLQNSREILSYYTGYFLRGLEGIIDILGYVPAEEKQSLIIADLVEYNSGWSIMVHLEDFLNIQAKHF